jgi:sterol desaturase/sphingolipid hydroxylase (fatty acid hydroxylase superfamily)
MASGRLFSLFLRRSGPRANDLGKMTLPELIVAYATYPTILLYAVLFAASVAGAAWLGAFAQPWRALLTVAVTIALFPFAEYVLHRYVLHARWLYKSPLTADLWRRIHYDHHQDPNRLDVLFGSPSNTLPAIVLLSLPIGLLLGGWGMALVSTATAFVLFAVYEFCHCVQHLTYTPKSRWLRAIKKNHMAHHFHNETGNFGITTNIVDHLAGSFYSSAEQRPRSPTTYNLGYDEAEAARYPWVAQRSGPARARPGAR